CACVLGEPRREHGADAVSLQRVDDVERDVRERTVADESRDPDRLAAQPRDEDVMVAVDAREVLEIRRAEHVLRASVPEPAGVRSEPVEDGLHDGGLIVSEWANRDLSDHFGVHASTLPAAGGPARRPHGPSFADGPLGPLALVYMDQNI